MKLTAPTGAHRSRPSLLRLGRRMHALRGALLLAAAINLSCTDRALTSPPPMRHYEAPMARRLTHVETLRWIADHRAWRVARKTKPIWARPVAPGEVGKEFHTADHAV